MKTISIANPEVTVIIPAYNRAELIGEALNSIFAQTYQNFEVIIVDDGSTDDTARVLKPLAEAGAIRYIHQENLGVSAARNRGITEARGEYMAFLDSDDLFEPEKLELQVEYMQTHPEAGLVHSGFTKFDNHGNDLGYRDTSWFSDMIYPQMLLYWTTLMAANTVLVPKRVFDSVGLFDESLRIGEDLDLWRRIARKYPFGFINKSLARVRVHQGNTSGNRLSVTDGFIEYLEQAFKDDPSLSMQFRRRAFSRMFSTMAYNLLGENGSEALQSARLNAGRAIKQNPLNAHGYMAFFSSLFGYNLRYSLIQRWRLIRASIMSRNRSV
ncbi:MAG: glycosyltransferase family 2 protein [Chloroflexi bacterium]|nr:glycosyltransferase family 2 protein [Chloroflexota bacterium]